MYEPEHQAWKKMLNLWGKKEGRMEENLGSLWLIHPRQKDVPMMIDEVKGDIITQLFEIWGLDRSYSWLLLSLER